MLSSAEMPLSCLGHPIIANAKIGFTWSRIGWSSLPSLGTMASPINGQTGRQLMTRLGSLTALLLVASPIAAMAMDEHVVVSADQLKWLAAPPAFPKGAQIAVLSGDPSKEGLYVIRLKAPAGYKVPPHSHPF